MGPDATHRRDPARRRLLSAPIGLGALAAAQWAPAQAQAPAWPNRAVRVLVGYAPGSSTDIVARVVASKLADVWKQPVVVENRGGAAGNLAAEAVAKGSSDGYTLLIAQNGPAISVGANPKLPFDGEKDLIAVAPVAATPHLLIVRSGSPVKTVDDLIALARSKPGALSYGSSGIGNSDHMSAELFKSMTGISAVHVPYRGGSLAAADLISGQIDYYFSGMPVGLPHTKGGRARAVAVTSRQRFPALPDTPTMAESGLPAYEVVMWQGVFMTHGTPPEIVAKVSRDVRDLLATDDMKEKLNAAGVQVFSVTSEQFGDYYRRDIARWRTVVKASNITLE